MKRQDILKTAIVGTFLFFIGCSGTSEPKQALDEYVTAVRSGDFKTAYVLNATTQKKVALAYRGAESGVEERLKQEFDYYKNLFDTANDGNIVGGQWEEKIYLAAASTFSITAVNLKEDTGSPSAKFKAKVYALAEMTIEYSDQNSAPIIGGQKVKKLPCEIRLIKGEDVIKGLPTDAPVRKWLFASLSLKREGIVPW